MVAIPGIMALPVKLTGWKIVVCPLNWQALQISLVALTI
jgi:hypothetical protein